MPYGAGHTAKKSFGAPVWVIACIESFSIWQMAVLYYSTKDFTIGGVTPTPVSVDSSLVFLVAGYIIGAALSYICPARVSVWGRVTAAVCLVCSALMFLRVPARVFVLLFYICAAGCTAFISVCATLIVNLYSLKTAVKDVAVATILTSPFVAILQSDFFNLDFRVFNACAVVVLTLMFAGLCRIPAKCDMRFLPRPKRRAAEKPPGIPINLLAGTAFVFVVASLCVLFSSTTAETLPNGIFVYYMSAAVWGGVFALLHYVFKVSPMRLFTIFLGICALGFILWLLPFGGAGHLALVLQGAGLLANFAAWFVTGVLFEKYNSRALAPLTVLTALAMVIVSSVLVNALRHNPPALYSTFAAIVLVLLTLYFLTEPYFQRVWLEALPADERGAAAQSELLAPLTKRELEVLPLVVRGYDNAAIADALFISENTVKFHVKNIFQKLGVHNRFELAAKINRYDVR